MAQSRLISIVAVCVLPFVVFGCSYGYHYEPVDSQGVQHPQWSETIDGVKLTVDRSHYSIGVTHAFQGLHVRSLGGKPVVVLGAQLISNGRTFDAEILNDALSLEARTVPPWKMSKIDLHWKLDKRVEELFGPDITWIWKIRIAKKDYTWRVPMRRIGE